MSSTFYIYSLCQSQFNNPSQLRTIELNMLPWLNNFLCPLNRVLLTLLLPLLSQKHLVLCFCHIMSVINCMNITTIVIQHQHHGPIFPNLGVIPTAPTYIPWQRKYKKVKRLVFFPCFASQFAIWKSPRNDSKFANIKISFFYQVLIKKKAHLNGQITLPHHIHLAFYEEIGFDNCEVYCADYDNNRNWWQR